MNFCCFKKLIQLHIQRICICTSNCWCLVIYLCVLEFFLVPIWKITIFRHFAVVPYPFRKIQRRWAQMRSVHTRKMWGERERERIIKKLDLCTLKNVQILCCAHWLEFVFSMQYVQVQLDITIQGKKLCIIAVNFNNSKWK